MALPISKTRTNGRLVNPDSNLLLNGFGTTAESKVKKHPLEISEATYNQRREQLNYSILQSNQGIGAPLKLLMERKAASQVGRLPFLPSSNCMLDTLVGRDETIDFEDIFNDPMEGRELMGTPLMVMERHLNIL